QRSDSQLQAGPGGSARANSRLFRWPANRRQRRAHRRTAEIAPSYRGTSPGRVMIGPNALPTVNAILNATSATLLTAGYVAIRRRHVSLHKVCMLSALTVSTLFLASYLYYHGIVRGGQHTEFGQGVYVSAETRAIYYTVLTSHTVLAILAAPLVLYTAYLGLRNRLHRHVFIARITLPIWFYVSITGVLVYWMLYHLYPAADATVQ